MSDERPTLPLSWDDWQLRTSWVRASQGVTRNAPVGLENEKGWWLVSSHAVAALNHAGELTMFDVLLFARRRRRIKIAPEDDIIQVTDQSDVYERSCPVCASPAGALCMREGTYRSVKTAAECWPNLCVHRARTEKT